MRDDVLDHVHDDSGAYLRRRQLDRRRALGLAILALALMVLPLASCATGKGFGLRADVTAGAPPSMAPETAGAYAAKTWRVVVVAREGAEAPVPIGGVEVVLWDPSALERRTATTGPDGVASFVCRCSPELYLGGERIDAAAQPDDLLPSVVNVLATVNPQEVP
jgi:predicted small secreted protein